MLLAGKLNNIDMPGHQTIIDVLAARVDAFDNGEAGVHGLFLREVMAGTDSSRCAQCDGMRILTAPAAAFSVARECRPGRIRAGTNLFRAVDRHDSHRRRPDL